MISDGSIGQPLHCDPGAQGQPAGLRVRAPGVSWDCSSITNQSGLENPFPRGSLSLYGWNMVLALDWELYKACWLQVSLLDFIELPQSIVVLW